MAGPNSYSGPLVANAGWASAPQGRLPDSGCPQPPACPACGGLECLCRPRFFAGQLLTEDDLNRLEGYVVAKNKLHNRYLHGWGVVCGLEVVCDPCGQGVVVRSGYALAPCGEDIVVCDDQVVDICALINACRPVYDPCPPMPAPGPANTGGVGIGTAPGPCGDVTDRWVLAICYDERPSRGVTPLRPQTTSCGCGSKSASGGCGCGNGKKTSGKSGGCGCGGRGATGGQTGQTSQSGKGCGCGTASKTAQSRGTYATNGAAAVACEPTLICEGYRFVAYKEANTLPTGTGVSIGPQATTPTADAGALVERVLCCIQALTSRLQVVPPNADNATLARWCCDTRAALIDLVTSHPTYDCGLAARARALVCPDPNQQDFDAALKAAVLAILDIAATYIRYCLCQALLPPCPDATDGDCVPLAVVEVRRSDCHVVDVCNWGPRKIALTFPQLAYWASPFHLGQLLQNAIERLCCSFVRVSRGIKIPGRPDVLSSGTAAPAPTAPMSAAPPATSTGATAAAATAAAAAENAGQTATRLTFEAFRTPSRQIDPETILLDALGFVDDKDQPLLTPLERASPVSTLVARQLTQPFGSSALPGLNTGAILAEALAQLVGGTPTPTPTPTPSPAPAPVFGLPAAPAGDIAELRRTVAELTKTVAAQGDEIKKLRNRRAPER
jgi:hypothetical protein